MAALLGLRDVAVVVDRLREGGRSVLAPVLRSGTLTVAPIDSLADLPTGWKDEQAPGSYRLVPYEGPALFAASAPTPGWKGALHPARALLIRAHRDQQQGYVVDDGEAAEGAETPLAFFGIRACDAAAIDRLDRVMLAEGAVDPAYAARRRDLLVVAVTCEDPGTTCFCASAGCGPVPGDDVDLRLTELVDHPDGHRVLAEPLTEAGAALVEGLGRAAAGRDLDAAAGIGRRAAARMGRVLDAGAVERAAGALEHPRWDEVATRCLACTNCTMVCPTCFCTTTEDRTTLDGEALERWRRWDSCFSLDFSWVHGGHIRPSVRARYRQWLLHKLVTWDEQFGTSGCVGCGRCITWCPAGIDLTEEIAAVGAAP